MIISPKATLNTITKIVACLVFAMIIAISAVRFFLNIQESSTLIYGIYLLAICIGVVHLGNRIDKYDDTIIVILVSAFSMIGYALITCLFSNAVAYVSTAKMIISMVVAYCVFLMNTHELRLTIRLANAIITLYMLYIWIIPNKINAYLNGGSNYLVMTLPIGLYCSMYMASSIFKLCEKKYHHLAIDLLMTFFSFATLTKFPGRGSLIFPFIVGIIIVSIIERKHIVKLTVALIAIIIVIVFAYIFFLNFASPLAIQRMRKLFNSNKSEDRWMIWSQYITYIFENLWIVHGGGVGASINTFGYYPHNLYLQLFGEFGLIGVFSGIITTTFVFTKSKWIINHISNFDYDTILLFYKFLAGLIYLFFCFMKSFSFYDSGTLMIFTMGLYSIQYNQKSCKIPRLLNLGLRYNLNN